MKLKYALYYKCKAAIYHHFTQIIWVSTPDKKSIFYKTFFDFKYKIFLSITAQHQNDSYRVYYKTNKYSFISWPLGF